MAILEEQRSLCEDLERLEQACADRILEEPKTVRSHSPTPFTATRSIRIQRNLQENHYCGQIRDRLARDHQIAKFVDRFQQQSQRLLTLKTDADGALRKELESLTTHDPFDEFYRQLGGIKDFHRRYPNEPVENLERAYKRRPAAGVGEVGGGAAAPDVFLSEIDALFTGEESNGRFFDLTKNHEEFLNLPGVKRITYLQYLSVYDNFSGFSRAQKLSEKYFQYLTGVADYLESFLRRTRPLEDPDTIVAAIEGEFTKVWEKDEAPGWGKHNSEGPTIKAESNGDAAGELFCDACQKSFSNKNVYDHHTSSKKHKKAIAAMTSSTAPHNNASQDAKQKADLARLKDRAVAEREWRIIKLTELMKEQREATTTNVERKQSLTERERQMELEALYAESSEAPQPGGNDGSEDEADDDSKIYNPLKLPLAWDGKPIPYWLYKLHGLGVEFPCEICGNFVYMGRRAFDKHFNEHRHIHGLRCLGITNTTLFREITKIDEAQRLWEKLEADKKKQKVQAETVEEMEDAQGNVMPRKVFEDLQKQGLL
jgi:splicing factor 3A subunit 3